MTSNWKITATASTVFSAVSIFLISTCPILAQEGVSDGTGNTQFRRTVDPSPRTAFGNASFRITNSGAKQTCSVQINNLRETDFGIFVGESAIPDTNSLVFGVAPLDRTGLKKGNWMRKLTGVNGAPLEFDVANLSDLSGGSIYIASPSSTFVGGVTNITGCVTNVSPLGVTNITTCTTNIYVGIPFNVGGTGTVSAVLWASIPPLVTNPSNFNYHSSTNLSRPSDPAPSPNAKGTVSVKFNNNQGRSVLDIRCTHLSAGQTYTLFIGDTTNNPPVVLVDAGTMTSNENGGKQQFRRDTKFGDPLPLQAPNVTDLSGHVIQIQDAFNEVHLEGVIP